ncbi:solute carrier family 25 (peroxisomal adenine nucleotide transporter), member 17 [Kwoniella heveanensis BCC8398]|uniref:Solute carrier family 25 (Peroxisomal adenine nucleotide transporter), member 17 n=1 Tax=Kwoniella heveanensis BCC8398 TaxID=1296120 RepID=A0A1B9GLX7_9TREE|nr:solute carrier family 25 (peroxisomal adenine nucleotide transporter), member 17 [Kwoniella heveanensis BCC8398]
MGDSAIHAVAGSVGGCVSMALTYPLVNLSTRAAVQTKKEHLTITQAIQKTLAEEGLSGLYSGLSSSLAGIAVTNGVYYAFYEETRSILLRRRANTPHSTSALTTGEGIIAGLIAGSITTLVTNPIWTVQTAQSTRAVTLTQQSASEGDGNTEGKAAVKKIKPSAVDAAREILKRDGVKGFWRGIGPALILVINPVIQYTTFERLVSVLLGYRLARQGATSTGQKALGRSSLSDWDLFILGAASKLVATGGTYPYIVVKSRLQAATHKYKSSLKAILHILESEGVSGLYAGLGPKLLQSVLTAAFMFVAQRRIYEFVKRVSKA